MPDDVQANHEIGEMRLLPGWYVRAMERLETSGLFKQAMVVVPTMFGLLSLLIGQDANWDLLNYHLYNPYAWLNGLVGQDLAPAGFQSYFNPLLDVPYYLMATHWPAWVVAGLMGWIHGLNFVCLLLITGTVVQIGTYRRVAAVLLALCGCCSAVFLSELGNTMGDNVTSVLVLAAIALLVRRWGRLAPGDRRCRLTLLLAGCLLGAAAGLKLTNAVYALAASIALLFAFPTPGVHRYRVTAWLSVGVVLGLTLTGGYWFLKMWSVFGNPLFPQFNNLFGSDMATGISVGDMRWRPTSVAEAMAFPFVFAWRPGRVGESPLHQIALPVLYVLVLAWAALASWRRWAGSPLACVPAGLPLSSSAKFLLVFTSVSYLLWMLIFSIHRYLVPMEMLAPLVIWLLAYHLFKPVFARTFIKFVLVGGGVVVVLTHTTWGNVGLAERAFRVEVPTLPAPERTAIVILQSGQHAWLLPFFPPGVRALSLASSFPESPAYIAKAKAIIQARSDNTYAIFEASKDNRPERIARLNGLLESFGLRSNGWGCQTVRWAVGRNSRLNALMTAGADSPSPCQLELDPARRRDLAAEDRDIAAQKANFAMKNYALHVNTASCVRRASWVGTRQDHYQFCRIESQP